MSKLFAVFVAFVCATSAAQPYVQGGSTVSDSRLGSATTSSIDVGYTAGSLDSTVGVFQARQGTPRGDVNWSGLSLGASLNAKLYGPVTGFVGYQVAQTPAHSKTEWDGRYGVGLTLHAKPAKVSLVIAPEQRAWDGKRAVQTIGLSVKIRGDL